MARSPLLSAYLATVNPAERGMIGDNTPARPEGAVVWVVCASQERLSTVQVLSDRLYEDGEIVTFIATLPEPLGPETQITPNTKRSTLAFLAHWKPRLVIWNGGALDAATLFAIQQANIPTLFVDAINTEIDKTIGRRVPGLLRNLLSSFSEILVADAATHARLLKVGRTEATTQITGMLEDSAAPPSYHEAERADLSETLGSRPMWFAADVPMAEIEAVAAAHRHAARRAHRTLLILGPRVVADGPEVVEKLKSDGFSVACRSLGEPPREATQIYVADTGDGIGLWSRLAPITYLGGSLSDGEICDPFAPATVGSAVLAGPHISDFKPHYDRLLAVGALLPVLKAENFGRAVESLLATDLAAQLAHNAWDETSRGADATNKLVALVYRYLDEVDR